MSENTIHPTAIVSSKAKLGSGNSIGAYSIISDNVQMGDNNKIGPHVVIEGHTKIGSGNEIFQFASIGAAPQDLKYKGEASVLELGDNNKVREFVTLQPGTEGGGMITKIGNRNLFMANCHVGHDAILGDSNVFANSAALAGHVIVGNGVTVGGLCGVHQFVKLGDLSILGAGSMVSKDIPPFCIAQGDRAGLVGINKVALERKGYSAEDISKVKKIFRELFVASGNLSQKIAEQKEIYQGFELGLKFLDFIEKSGRGCAGARRGDDSQSD